MFYEYDGNLLEFLFSIYFSGVQWNISRAYTLLDIFKEQMFKAVKKWSQCEPKN